MGSDACQKCYTGEPHEHGAGLAIREERRTDQSVDVLVLSSRVDGLEGQVRSLVEALAVERERVARLEEVLVKNRERVMKMIGENS